MPTYQYRCTDCGEPLEVVQSFTDDPLTECPSCSGQLRKVFSSVGIVFKGSGFYRTDSRSSSNGAKGDGETKPAKSDGDSGSATKESPKESTKPAAKETSTSSGGSSKDKSSTGTSSAA